MARITYVEFNGTPHDIDVPPGQSVMEGAVRNGVPGIDADCGGNCACATCHVYVDEAWVAKVAAPEAGEQSMLEFVRGAKPNSRLSCQMAVTAELDGLVVSMPDRQ
jgi:2Fe-2S ferredoxin